MKIEPQDFKRLRLPAILLTSLCLLGALAVAASLAMQKAGEREYRDAVARRSDVQSKLARARDEEQELRAKIVRYQGIVARGYVGPERRLDWIEAIARFKGARRLLDVQYEFLPQRPAEAALVPGGPAAGNYQVVASQMRLTLPLLHEGDLLGFLGDLRDNVPALIQVRSCDINRVPRGDTERTQRAQLDAQCVLEWITFKETRP